MKKFSFKCLVATILASFIFSTFKTVSVKVLSSHPDLSEILSKLNNTFLWLNDMMLSVNISDLLLFAPLLWGLSIIWDIISEIIPNDIFSATGGEGPSSPKRPREGDDDLSQTKRPRMEGPSQENLGSGSREEEAPRDEVGPREEESLEEESLVEEPLPNTESGEDSDDERSDSNDERLSSGDESWDSEVLSGIESGSDESFSDNENQN